MARDPLIGALLGNIQIERLLGQGGMGAVYQGRNPTSGQQVAVKVLHPSRGDSEGSSFKERFLREIRVTSQIHHPHVVQVLDAGVAGDRVYLVMELVVGESLGARLDREGCLELAEMRRIAQAMMSGVAAIHAQGIIHRDIKPDNVLLGKDGSIKIADLGLARPIDDPHLKRLTVSGVVVGTPLYLAPEAIRDSRLVSSAADIYALGATWYHCLTGKPPFDAPSAYDVMRLHLEERPRPVREINRTVPKALDELLQACLAKEPQQRPSARAIHGVLAGGRRLKGSGSGLGLVAVLLCALVGAAAIVAWRGLEAAANTSARYSRAQTPDAARVEFSAAPPGARVRINQGPWQAWRSGAWFFAPGPLQVEAEVSVDGALLFWQAALTLGSEEQRRLLADFQPAFLPQPSRIDLARPASCHIYCQGTNRGLVDTLWFDRSGTYVVAAWDGITCQERTVQVYRDGSSDPGTWVTVIAPSPQAYCRTQHGGSYVPAHHLVSWWELERARASAALPTPDGWTRQALRAEQPGVGLDAALIDALVAWRSPHGLRLATADEAETLSIAYGSPMWFRAPSGALLTTTGGRAQAVLPLLPQRVASTADL